jgi:hypothetical protein
VVVSVRTLQLSIGAVLPPDDVAADKMLALWGRAEIRDYVDVAALRAQYSATRLMELAAAKDPGFTPATFAPALAALRRFDDEDWAAAGIDEAAVRRVKQLMADWGRELNG